MINYIIDQLENFDYSIVDKDGETAPMKMTDPHVVNLAMKMFRKIMDSVNCDNSENKIDQNSKTYTESQNKSCFLIFKRFSNKNWILHELVLKKNRILLEFLLKNKEFFGIDATLKNSDGKTYSDLEVC